MRMRCGRCGTEVPPGPFCGQCGARLTPRPGDGPAWLRPGIFFGAPHESVLRPSLASSLLPQLSDLTRRPFNAGLLLIIVSMAVLAELRVPGGLLTVAALGLPLLVIIYWRRSRVFDDVPRWSIIVVVVLAIVVAGGWVVLTGDLVLRQAASPFDPGAGGRRALRYGLGIYDSGALLMLAPLCLTRLLWRGERESLDGFVIGVLGALAFTTTATLSRLAPQFLTTSVPRNQPLQWLFFEAAVRGVTVPLTAACAGGLVGAALWFHRPSATGSVRRPTVLGVLLLLVAAVFGIYAAVGRADTESTSRVFVLMWHIGMALFAVIALRIGLQFAVLHEDADDATGAPFLCLPCRQVIPEMTFCPSCGAATRASPRHSRGERRRVQPAEDDTAAPLWPGFDVPARTYTAQPVSRQSPLPVLTNWAITMVAFSVVFIGLPALIVPAAPRYNCPPDCGMPPSGTPVSTNPRFVARDFSVAYPAAWSAYAVRTDASGVTARLTAGDGGELRLMGQPAAGGSAREVARTFIATTFPTAKKAYEIPNAMIGFQRGYGEVADVFPLNLDTSSVRMRAVVIVAVKNDIALIAAGFGPYHRFGPDFGPGRPSAANLQIAEDMGRYVNSFRWSGDPPR